MASMLMFLVSLAALSRAALVAEGKVSLEGDSTLHPYRARASEVKVAVDPEGRLPDGVRSLEVRIPVRGLHSEHSGLDKNMHAALKAEEHPDIVFLMKDYTASSAAVRVRGELTVAGNSKPVTLDAATSGAGGAYTARGTLPLKMTDFGIKPPKMMLGAIKARDEVLIRFEAALRAGQGDRQ